jgi:hypothetical protein
MRTWDLWAVICLYSLGLFLFGFWVEYRLANLQLKRIVEQAYSEGCDRCAQFEKDACTRDNTLQGTVDHPEPIK